MDPYMIVTLIIMVAFTATFALLVISAIIENARDDEPWMTPHRHHPTDREHWES